MGSRGCPVTESLYVTSWFLEVEDLLGRLGLLTTQFLASQRVVIRRLQQLCIEVLGDVFREQGLSAVNPIAELAVLHHLVPAASEDGTTKLEWVDGGVSGYTP